MIYTIDFPDTSIVVLVDMALDDDIRTILVAKNNFNPPFVGTMLDELGNFFGATEQLSNGQTLRMQRCIVVRNQARFIFKCPLKVLLTLVFQPSPKARAQTMVLLPVPLGPIIMFRLGPGVKLQNS